MDSDKQLNHYKWMLDNLKLNDHHRWWVKREIYKLESEREKVSK